MNKTAITLISITLGIMTTIAGLLIVNYDRIQKWKLFKEYWGSSYPTKNIYIEILFSSTALIIFIVSSIAFGIIIATINYLVSQSKNENTKQE